MSGKTDKKAIFKLENDAQFEKLHQRLYDDLRTVHGQKSCSGMAALPVERKKISGY